MNKYLAIALAIIIAILSVKGTAYFYSEKLEEARTEIRASIIKNGKLEKINEGLYSNIVADTLKQRELNKIIDSLKLEVKKPTIITKVVFVPKEIIKEVDVVVFKDSTIHIKDSYPNKVSPFVEYEATISLQDSISIGKFSFNPIEFNIAIGQNQDGTFQINTKVPEFIEVTGLTVKSLPMTKPTPDNFGILFGAGYGNDFGDSSKFVQMSAGIRFKKLYLEIQGATNNTVVGGLKIEF